MTIVDIPKIITCVAAVTMLAVAAFSTSEGIIENWGGIPSQVPRAQPVYASSPQAAMKGQIFAAPPNAQALIAPRMAGMVQIPASISYRMPAEKNMAFSTKSPLTPSPDMCGAGGGRPGMQSSLSSIQLPTIKENFGEDQQNMNRQNPSMLSMNQNATVKAQMMMGSSADGGGSGPDAPIMIDRYLAANRNDRLRGLGCQIRGDLPIKKCNTGWFQVAADPSLTLQQGAMNVLGGVYNETANEMASLINMSSGGAVSNIAGVNMTNQFNECLVGAGQDVNVTAFPAP
jgi:hypothetical protein